MKILIAEDDPVNARVVQKRLVDAGYQVTWEINGKKAFSTYQREFFDLVITDWMMPEMDGIGLIQAIHKFPRKNPGIIVLTALDSKAAREHAITSGADDYLAKPVSKSELLERVSSCLAKIQDGLNVASNKAKTKAPYARPAAPNTSTRNHLDYPGVFVAASTGGPMALRQFLSKFSADTRAAFFVVQHGPKWMLETLTQSLNQQCSLKVKLAEHGLRFEPGTVYISPGETHLGLYPAGRSLRLIDAPKENFVRPAADVLFRDGAKTFGPDSIGVVLTGLGKDGTQGSLAIHAAGGDLFIQDPTKAVAPAMPTATLRAGLKPTILSLDDLPSAVNARIIRHLRPS